MAATGARAYRPDVGSRHQDSIEAGDEIVIGKVRIRAIPTPGHRPEHLSYEVIDTKRDQSPWILLTGDTLLVGDVARPDLAYESVDGARALHHTLARLTSFTDHVEVWPAHIGGSLCGGVGLSGKPSSTVGFERRNNPLLTMARDEFVQELTTTLPTRPPNVERIVALNCRSQAEFEPPPDPPLLDAPELSEIIRESVTVLDCRLPELYDAGHLGGSLNLPVGYSGAGTRAGWTLDPEQEAVIVAGDEAEASEMINALQAVGFHALRGITIADADSWARDGLAVQQSSSWDIDKLAAGLRVDAVDLIDVREPSEWADGHVRGSHHVPLHRLRDIDALELPANGRTTVVACAAGARAAFAASLLRHAGRNDVVRAAGGGVPDLEARGIRLELGAEPDAGHTPAATS